MPSSKNYKQFNCVVCGDSFKVHPKGSYKAKYCSYECQASVNQSTERQYERMNAEDSPKRYFAALLGNKNRRSLSVEDLMSIWEDQKGICALSNVPMTYKRMLGQRITTNASIDRIEVGGPYIKSNVRLVCAIVNKMRLDMSDTELKYWCKQILGEDHS